MRRRSAAPRLPPPLVLLLLLFLLQRWDRRRFAAAYINDDSAALRDRAALFVQACGHRADDDLGDHVVRDDKPSMLPAPLQQAFDGCNLPRARALAAGLVALAETLCGQTDARKAHVNRPDMVTILGWNGPAQLRAPVKGFAFLRRAQAIEKQVADPSPTLEMRTAASVIFDLAEEIRTFLQALSETAPPSPAKKEDEGG